MQVSPASRRPPAAYHRRVRSRATLPLLAALGAAACGAPAHPQAPAPTSTVEGLVRDAATGEPLARAGVRATAEPIAADGRSCPAAGQTPVGAALVADSETAWAPAPPDDGAAIATTAGDTGGYRLAGLAAGCYRLIATYAGKQVEVAGVALQAGRSRGLDLLVDLTQPLTRIRLGTAEPTELRRFRQRRPTWRGAIEGTVSDERSAEPTPGAVVSCESPALGKVLQAVADNRGHFELPDLPPGTYTLSIYYHLIQRGNVEIRRTDVGVVAGETTLVEMRLDSQGVD
jgi:hypothetical protein